MQPFTRVSSKLIPLLTPNVDTDQIIPAQYVNVAGKEALCDALFARLKAEQADFVFNRPEMKDRAILLTGPNFGCGSAREAAAWALDAAGIRAMIGTTFNENFSNNCLQNGLLPLSVEAALHERLVLAIQRVPTAEVTIDLIANRIEVLMAGLMFAIRLDPFVRNLLVRGIDELSYLLERRDLIKAFEARRIAG
jgi:3-isopropylmalate/(R)-2-methylmalate dehydratase small subunit